MGWNSWNSGIDINDQSIRGTIDAMVSSGMRDAGYSYVNLDAGWAAPERSSTGELAADPQRFPFGLKPLADYAHERGLRFGLYSSPFNQTCGQSVGAASLGHETQDAATFAAWGIDFLKYDWCGPKASHDEQTRIFGAMGSALRKSGRRIVYSINPNSADDPAAGARFDWSGVADMVRVCGDLVPLWRNALPPLGSPDPFAARVFNALPDQLADAVNSAARPAYRNDPDMLVVGVTWSEFFLNHRELVLRSARNRLLTADQRVQLEPLLSMSAQTAQWMAAAQPGLTEDEQRSHFSLWAMLGAPLLAGNDLRSMSAATSSMLTNREVIAVDQDPLLATAHQVGGDGRIFAKPLADSSVAVALFNSSNAVADIATTAHAVGLPPASCYTLRDLWTGQSVGTAGGIVARSVAPHAVQLLRAVQAARCSP
ncbi:glycoside hydrolase family 27 protein [Segniliparus rotundus]|nr:glycoside hydrolase family 27 protein [Segniliparus rotundus]